ncbi:MAG: hypothetical protein LBG13_03665 [Holosporales bacterium]|jgi:hypothetical protein|nr:hypothetical protein [Holosporales bacterium]
MSVGIFQRDITGALIELEAQAKKKRTASGERVHTPTTGYRSITLRDGCDGKNAESDSMLIHRILQRKVIYGGLNSSDLRSILLKIIKNEMAIKIGEIDSVSATRDSLIIYELLKK